MKSIASTLVVALLLAMTMKPIAAEERDLSCNIHFTSKQWSAVYASSEGVGTVACKDGSSMQVAISAKGIGITAGKWRITDGKGTFTHVRKIEDVLGSYLAVSGDVGLSKAGTAQVLTKGKVSLALAGTGEGFDVGVAISDFKISKAAERDKPAGK